MVGACGIHPAAGEVVSLHMRIHQGMMRVYSAHLNCNLAKKVAPAVSAVDTPTLHFDLILQRLAELCRFLWLIRGRTVLACRP
jgi:hypothetical protein